MMELLDHGYIKIVDTMGSDQSIIEAARMSTVKGFLGWEPGQCPICLGSGKQTIGDKGDPWVVNCGACEGKGHHPGDQNLLRYLYTNRHDTPFEFAQIVFEVQAPIFVFREWHRHRTQGYNEMSARYTPLPDLYYIPSIERLMINASESNKQAGTVKDAYALTEKRAQEYRQELQSQCDVFQDAYESSLEAGIPKELARCGMPVCHYSRMRATANLRNWLGFMSLRSATGAQWEIRQYSNAINTMLSFKYPRTMELFNVKAP